MKMVFISGLVALLAVAACAKHTEATTEADASTTFVANVPQFAPFLTWTSYMDTLADDGSLPTGVGGPRTQYINMLPPHGATQFPTGTIIVEVREDGKIFASVKRGGDFNAAGCVNWEFFELTENPVTITWRGLGPPLGDTYGGDPNGCNDCHTMCASNDYICSPKLQLSSF
jgi:hypothetical protein